MIDSDYYVADVSPDISMEVDGGFDKTEVTVTYDKLEVVSPGDVITPTENVIRTFSSLVGATAGINTGKNANRILGSANISVTQSDADGKPSTGGSS